ncbi:hypothetical protein SLEP1_g43713 [Rubroshorea leprosula]|uniref:Uncharacterized protein n=1 Tax=Rubroshorea leprosula TaxID=152421 RepID=A0AAV5LDV6_9ROSI|nr:hypothetical protein SLEP1_g43713 [Rubroshorea leprosula]
MCGNNRSGSCWLLLVQEEIFGDPEGIVSADETNSYQENRDEETPDTSEEDNEDAKNDEDAKRLVAEEGAAEENQWLIRRAEEDHANDCQIVDAKIQIIPADTNCSLSKRLRFGKGRAIGEFGPRTTLGEAILEGFGNVGDEDVEGEGSDG